MCPRWRRPFRRSQNGGISRDGKTIVLHLRHGMRWSDGAPLDARDLRFTWQAVMNQRNNTRLRAGWDDITAIDLPDNDTAVVHLRAPYAAILGIFALGGAGYPPLPAHLSSPDCPISTTRRFNEQPLSSGPYVLTALESRRVARIRRQPALLARQTGDRPSVLSASSRTPTRSSTSCITHAIDVDAENVTETQIGRLGALTGFTTQKRLIANYRHITFNTRKPALTDVRVRRAIAEAVDWDHLNATVFHGYNERATSDIVPTSWAAPDIPPCPYDPGRRQETARCGRLAARDPTASGAANGVRLALDISTTPSKPSNVQAEVQMQQELRAVGIDLRSRITRRACCSRKTVRSTAARYDLSLTIDTNAPDPDNEGSGAARSSRRTAQTRRSSTIR